MEATEVRRVIEEIRESSPSFCPFVTQAGLPIKELRPGSPDLLDLQCPCNIVYLPVNGRCTAVFWFIVGAIVKWITRTMAWWDFEFESRWLH